MEVVAYVLDDLTAIIGDREVLQKYMGKHIEYLAQTKNVIEIDIPNSAIKKVYHYFSEKDAKNIILGKNEYQNPLRVVFDSDTYNSYRNQLTKIIEA